VCEELDYFKIDSNIIREILKGSRRELITEYDFIMERRYITIKYEDNNKNILLFYHIDEEELKIRLINIVCLNSDKSINITINENPSNGIYNQCIVDEEELGEVEFNNKILYIDDKELKINK